MKHVWLNETLSEAISSKRMHHQLMPMQVECESGFENKYIEGLRQKGHKVKTLTGLDYSVVITGISRVNGHIEAVSDLRNGGGGVVIN